jgi:hypothetical protein
MGQDKNAFSREKHRAVKDMKHKALEIFISIDDIFQARAAYPEQSDYWRYVRDQFLKKHNVLVLDTEKLVMYTTVDDNTMKIVGHKGYSLSEPRA